MSATRKRICIMLPRLSRYGGVETFGCRLAEALAAEGHAVDFICARVESAPPAGVRPVVVGRYGHFAWARRLWFALAAEHARRSGGYDFSIGLGKTLRQDLLRVSGGTLKSFWRLSIRGYAPGMPRRIKALIRRLDPGSFVTEWIEARQLADSGLVAAVSHRTRDWLVEDHSTLSPDSIRVIYNQPDLTRFSPCPPEARPALRERFGMQAGELSVGFAATSFPRKGLTTLVEALALLPASHRLHVAGGRNPRQYARQAERLGLAGRVVFHGAVADMPDFYNACDVFALPSHYDTCANAPLEAMACGTPTIASADDGASFFADPRLILPDTEDAVDLAAKITLAASLPRTPFHWPADVPSGLQAWLALVRELLGQR